MWSPEVSSKNGRDSRSRETKVGEKIAATSGYPFTKGQKMKEDFFIFKHIQQQKKLIYVVINECSSSVKICSVLCSSNQDLPGLRKNFGQQLQRFFRSNDLEFVKILFNHQLASTLFGWKEDTIYLMSIVL